MKVLLLFSLILSFTKCWWDGGHMLVAQVAKTLLIAENKTLFDIAEEITNIMNGDSHGEITDFVESACYPDDVKSHGLTELDNLHFMNVPVFLPYNSSAEQIVPTPFDSLSILVRLKLFIFRQAPTKL